MAVGRMYWMMCAVSGVIWGLLGWLLSRQYFAPAMAGAAAVAVSPLIGLLIGRLYLPVYSRSNRVAMKFLMPLVTLYLAVALFGIATGVGDALTGPRERFFSAVVIQSLFGFLWGLTFVWIWVLYPLAFLNHYLLGGAAERYNKASQRSAARVAR